MSKLSQSVILVLVLTVLAFPPPLSAQPGPVDVPVNVDRVGDGWRVYSEGPLVVTVTKYEEMPPQGAQGKRTLTPMAPGETRVFTEFRDITIYQGVLHIPCPDCGPCRTGECPPTPPIEEPDAMTNSYFLDPCEGVSCSAARRDEYLRKCADRCTEIEVYIPTLEFTDGQ